MNCNGVATPAERSFEEIIRAAHRINPGIEAAPCGAFLVGARPSRSDWELWIEGIWLPLVSPVFHAALSGAREGKIRELAALDLSLDERIAADSAASSRAAGLRLLRLAGLPRGERPLRRYQAAVAEGRAAGHLACVWALRAALFHLPADLAAGAYLYQEASAAFAAAMNPALPELIASGLASQAAETADGPSLRRLA